MKRFEDYRPGDRVWVRVPTHAKDGWWIAWRDYRATVRAIHPRDCKCGCGGWPNHISVDFDELQRQEDFNYTPRCIEVSEKDDWGFTQDMIRPLGLLDLIAEAAV